MASITTLLLFSCATILHGTKEKMSVDSDPAGAHVMVKTIGGVEVYQGETPTQFKLAKGKEYNVFIKLDGYKEEKVFISKNFDPITLGNILCGGIIGLIVDASNGAMYNLEPKTVVVTLQTAFNESGEEHVYAIFRAVDEEGQIHSNTIPLLKE